MSNPNWRRVTKADPCPICRKPDWCQVSADGEVAHCMKSDGGKPAKSGGWIHRLRDDGRAGGGGAMKRPIPKPKPAGGSSKDWAKVHAGLRAKMTPDRLEALATATGIPSTFWAALDPGWCDSGDLQGLKASGAGWAESRPAGAWAIPERDGSGRVVGLSLRSEDGRKGAPSGSGRGLVVPARFDAASGPVLVVEGASDVAAAVAMGLRAVGRPSNTGGAEALAAMLDGEEVLIVGERDRKDDGRWPGRDGARSVAAALAGSWDLPVKWTLPPADVKDLREYYKSGKTDGAVLLKTLSDAAKDAKAQRRSQADVLVGIAKSRYRLGQSLEGEPFAVASDGPQLVRLFRGGSSLRGELSRAYFELTRKAASASALTDCLMTLEGEAQTLDREPLPIRLSSLAAESDETADGVVVDLGSADGAAVVIRPGCWAVEAVSPALFRRSALTGEMPRPIEANPDRLTLLKRLLNVKEASWPLLVGWMVAAFMPDPPHPVLMIGGEAGAGKSSAAKVIVWLCDPSPAELRSEPKDPESWAVAAAGSWLVCVDNVSHISAWFSDALCKAVTGDGWVKRRLYSDGDLQVSRFKRAMIVTSIDAGALRGDLADRLLMIDLERIPEDHRRTEADLRKAFQADRSEILGALLSVVARTLEKLPGVKLSKMPRMADFAVVLSALDEACPEVTDGQALTLFMGQSLRIVEDVLDADAVAVAIRALMDRSPDGWCGTATELLTALSPMPRPQGWPKTGRGLVGHVRRIGPALRTVGIFHYPPADGDKLRKHRLEMKGETPPEPPEPPEMGLAVTPEERPTAESSGGLGGSGDHSATYLADEASSAPTVEDYGELELGEV